MTVASTKETVAKPRRTRGTPQTTTNDPAASIAASSPTSILRRPSSQPFEAISLPWTSSTTEALSQELGPRFDDLIVYTLRRLPAGPPRVLRPSVLKTSVNEDRRLRLELARLRAKYDSITQHRDSLLVTLTQTEIMSEPASLRKTADSLRKAVSRCDRIARQIFICNDQIRQIEVQGEAHIVGALRVALARAQEAMRTRVSSLSGTSESEAESDVTTSCETSETGHELSHVNIRRVTFVQTSGANESGRDLPATLEVTQNDGNRLSVATIISLNQLGFPIPPDRHIESPSSTVIPSNPEQGALGPAINLGAGTRVEDDRTPLVEELRLPLTGRSASLSQLQVTAEASDEIVIYPPSHRRSTSLPEFAIPGGMDLPRTPWNDACESPPPASRSSNQAAKGITSPLRVKSSAKPRTRATGAKSVSLKAQRRMSDTTKRARRGRESQLDTPESILLSLATAEFWTKADMDDMEFLTS